MYKQILIFLCLVYSCFPLWGQEHQWHEPFFVNVDLGGDARADMKVDNLGNTYLMLLFEDEVTILDTTLYTSKDNGVLVAKFDLNHNLIWSKVVAEAKEATPNQTRVLGSISLELDNSTNDVYLNIGYADSTYFDNQLYTVNHSLTYYQDLAILKISQFGNIESQHHIKGSCTSVMGNFKIQDDFLYFHIHNQRNQLDADSVCSCILNSDTTIYSIKNEGVIGRLNKSNFNIDWIKVYKAGISDVTSGKIAVKDSNLYISGYIFSASDLVIGNDSMVVPNSYSKYGYLSRFKINGTHKWSKYFAVKGWDSKCPPVDLKVNSNNDIVLLANVRTQSVSNQVFFENASTLTGATNNDESFVVVNYDSLGNVKWHDISNNLGYERMISIDFDSHKNMYLAGKFSSEDFTFGSQYIEGYGFSNDILIISYDSVGNKRWAQKAGGNGSDIGAFMSIDSSDVLHVGGFITASSATFGVHETTPPSPGNSLFIAQMQLEPIGLDENTPQQFGVSVYPNPSIGTVNIKVVDEFISQVKVYNGFGQEIKNLNFENQTDKVNVENLSSGYYILDIHVESGKHVAQKLIVK